jgi:flagellar biosynthetic protein FliQ
MDSTAVLDIAMDALMVGAKLSAPMLLTALVVGLGISIVQSITQIQEVTVAFVPKLVAVGIALVVTGQWMISELMTFTTGLFDRIPTLLGT